MPTQSGSPDLFPGLGAPGLDFLILGPGQIPQQILTQDRSTGSFPGLGALESDFLILGPGQIL
jgi:hypothetical protein